MALNENDIKIFFKAIERESSDSESIYQWTKCLSELLKNAPEIDAKKLERLSAKVPALFEVETPESDWTLALTREELIRGRIYLWTEGFYQRSAREGFHFSPSTTRISQKLYPNLLSKPNTGLSFDELSVGAYDSYAREAPSVDVRTAEKEGTQISRTSAYKREFFSLGVLYRFGCEVPVNLLDSIDQLTLINPENLKLPGRFRTLPFPVPMKALREGVEFFYEHGEHLTASYANVLAAAAAEKMDVLKFVDTKGIDAFLELDTRKLGVVAWSVASYYDPKFHLGSIHTRKRVEAAVYFSALRRNIGLVDLIRVLYGGCQSTVGMMMARRNGELLDLLAGKALDVYGKDLAFANRKTGIVGFRQIELRPIPHVGAEMIALLTDFQKKLVSTGNLKALTRVFSLPTVAGNLVSGSTYYNYALDAFCDYIEIPKKNGARYYIRQHQLRRVFAIAFLYAAGGDAETLRWFLGQLDPEHLWNYITDAMPGDMLQYVEAYFVTEKMQSSGGALGQGDGLEIAAETEKRLRELVQERFGTSNYALIDTESLSNFVAMQMSLGMVVEPHFYQTSDGKRYQILVHMREDKR
jgi:hypothetical protein